ncbi:hypothetical protein [Corynebacterium epidermidicanis]|uniref:Uncharacterized protein n=1 Tax=Corynebacterium epidermidicanis TaxID=1050174 RepID=A0A0G3GY00_9CORY|nr:hypothetical protein [Corynebacterium epidermidicanis]AKK03697.1 hypothetical protein CEPID_09255 [Corynebacterium epidermidicanis]
MSHSSKPADTPLRHVAESLQESPKASTPHIAGAFDIRNVIGALIGIYGIVLIVCSFVLDPGYNPENGELKSAADNLWAGIGMLIVGIGFMVWARLRPIIVNGSD